MHLNDLVLYIHLGSLVIAAVGVCIADKVGFSWIRGKVNTLSPHTLRKLHNTISYALASLILSGLYLFWPIREYLLTQPLFLFKLVLIAMLVINSVAIDRLMTVATKVPFTAISGKGKAALFASGALSFAAWVGTVASAWFIFGWPF